ncbi:MAG: hypothetical protein WAM79_07430 [Candidatus Sulfotelmatobacter sp.]
MDNLAGVVQQLKKERDRAAKQVKSLDAALAALDGVSGGKSTGSRRGSLSTAARARIAAAQRARWAKVRGQIGQSGQKPKVVSMPKKKTMSAVARRKIAAAQRARWAKLKAGQKKKA